MTKHDKLNFWILIICILGAIGCIHKVTAQTPPGAPFAPQITSGTAVPSLCNNGQLFYQVNNYNWYTCGPTNTYNILGGPGGSGVSSFNTRTGAITLTLADITSATGQNLSSTGSPTFNALTVSSCTGCGGASGVSSFNTRTGAVTLSFSDITTAIGTNPLVLGTSSQNSEIFAGTNNSTVETAGFINNNASGIAIDAVASNSTGSVAIFQNMTGTCQIEPTTTALVCTSDETTKKNDKTITSSLNSVMKLRPITYEWRKSNEGKRHAGFFAQEVQQVLPDLVGNSRDGKLTLNSMGMVPYLVKAIQELQNEVTELKAEKASY